jgi:hypothetical protein
MDFITWYFDKHPVVSTIMTLDLSCLWAIYSHNMLRFAVTFGLWLLLTTLKVVGVVLKRK